jgi:hypothetical protein
VVRLRESEIDSWGDLMGSFKGPSAISDRQMMMKSKMLYRSRKNGLKATIGSHGVKALFRSDNLTKASS